MTREEEIKAAIRAGMVTKAAVLMGHPFTIVGEVVRHKGRGTEIGIPTANIRLDDQPIIPKMGVYYAMVRLPDRRSLPALANIGDRPTFGGEDLWLAVHIFDFDEPLWGRTIQVDFLAWIRSEERFVTAEEMVRQIKEDIEVGRKLAVGGR